MTGIDDWIFEKMQGSHAIRSSQRHSKSYEERLARAIETSKRTYEEEERLARAIETSKQTKERSEPSTPSGGSDIIVKIESVAAEIVANIGQITDMHKKEDSRVMPRAEAPPEVTLTGKNCAICLDALATDAAIPCGHRYICTECRIAMQSVEDVVCAICREKVLTFIRIWDV